MTPHTCPIFNWDCYRCDLAADELVGTEWDDQDPREEGRRIQIVAVVPRSDDGWGGPVYDAICIANRKRPHRIGHPTRVGSHGLRLRWASVDEG